MKSLEASKRVCPMDEHERFIKLYDVIPEIFRTYMNNFAWTVGLLSVANGWFLSSASSRDFIRNSTFAFFGANFVIFSIGLLHMVSCWMYYRHSQERVAQLTTEYTDLSPLPFQDYEITRSILLINLLVSWSLIAGLLIQAIAARR